MIRRRLPLLVERALAEVREAQGRIGSEFEQTLFGMTMEEESGPPLSCRKGCHNCCLHPVAVSVMEGLLLYRHLVSRGMWTPKLRAACQAAAQKSAGLSFEVWMLAALPCVLLTPTGLCSAYDVRPVSCRTVFSIGDAEKCHPHHIASSTDILPRQEPLRDFEAAETEVLRRLGVHRLLTPLPYALLLAEKVEEGEVEVGDVDKTIAKGYGGEI